MVNAVSGATSSQSAAASSGGAVISSDFQTFLMMLTTQMQNQDPLNPIDSSDYAVQLATFSGVEQAVKTNQLLESLSSQMGLMGMAQFASWVGMEARTAAPAYFDGQTPLTLSPNPQVRADRTVLVVRDASGNEVARNDIPATSDPYEWAGTDSSGTPFAAGQYSFHLENYQNGALLAEEMVEVYSPIIEARGGATGTVLVLRGGATVLTTDVTALRTPDRASL
jgi:flagellar basal-body rod modification protein FlgD